MTTLYIRDGSDYREAETQIILSEADALISLQFRTGIHVMNDAAAVRHYLRLHLAPRDYEVFGLLHLNTRNRLLAVEELFRGTIDGASVFPREIVKSVLAHHSAAVILFHNHPSQSCCPSAADEAVTKRLQVALETIEVKVLDHLIVGAEIYSFAEHGRL
jgi:DNA repair protein RadC